MKKVIILLSLILTSLTACSRLDLAFHWADTYITSKIDDYFDITFQQTRTLKKSLKTDLDKVRAEVLPELLKQAEEIRNNISSGNLDKNTITSAFNSLLGKIKKLTASFSGTAADFISVIPQKQIEYFIDSFREKSQEDHDNLRKEKQTKDVQKKYNKYFEMFLGSLTEEQKTMIAKHIEQAPFPSELKLKNKEWIFQQFMKQRASKPELKIFVKNFLSQPDKMQLPEYSQALQEYYLSLRNLLVEFAKTLTTVQKKALLENLQDKMNQLEKIRDHG